MPSSPLLRPASIVAVAVVALVVGSACARSIDDGVVATDLGMPQTLPKPQNACIDTACPAPFATCGSSDPCAVDLLRDPEHCGSCEHACPKGWKTQGTFLCDQGTCQLVCGPGWADCDGIASNGCETPLDGDPKNCGGCGIACKGDDPCWLGACGCPKGFTLCGKDCKKLDSDDKNCGACGQECSAPSDPADPRWVCGPKVTPANMAFRCGESQCTLQCMPGWGNCNKDECGDGCEIDLKSDPNNCGACGHACDAGQACVNGTCLCPAGTTLCGSECVDLQRDPLNCGRCYESCPGAYAEATNKVSTGGAQCIGGSCSFVCYPGFADCDKDLDNGCETDLRKDQRHCGACNVSCNVKGGQPCVSGVCLTKPCEESVVK